MHGDISECAWQRVVGYQKLWVSFFDTLWEIFGHRSRVLRSPDFLVPWREIESRQTWMQETKAKRSCTVLLRSGNSERNAGVRDILSSSFNEWLRGILITRGAFYSRETPRRVRWFLILCDRSSSSVVPGIHRFSITIVILGIYTSRHHGWFYNLPGDLLSLRWVHDGKKNYFPRFSIASECRSLLCMALMCIRGLLLFSPCASHFVPSVCNASLLMIGKLLWPLIIHNAIV